MFFLKNSYFFKIEKFQFLRKMEDFCHFDALNFLKVKSGEKDKDVSKRLCALIATDLEGRFFE